LEEIDNEASNMEASNDKGAVKQVSVLQSIKLKDGNRIELQ
jgi:hypothetical protein